jgi:hypothetical protein
VIRRRPKPYPGIPVPGVPAGPVPASVGPAHPEAATMFTTKPLT